MSEKSQRQDSLKNNNFVYPTFLHLKAALVCDCYEEFEITLLTCNLKTVLSYRNK